MSDCVTMRYVITGRFKWLIRFSTTKEGTLVLTYASQKQNSGLYTHKHALIYNLGSIGYSTEPNSQAGHRTIRKFLRATLAETIYEPPEDDPKAWKRQVVPDVHANVSVNDDDKKQQQQQQQQQQQSPLPSRAEPFDAAVQADMDPILEALTADFTSLLGFRVEQMRAQFESPEYRQLQWKNDASAGVGRSAVYVWKHKPGSAPVDKKKQHQQPRDNAYASVELFGMGGSLDTEADMPFAELSQFYCDLTVEIGVCTCW